MKKGIDISYCQGSPDFAKVRGAVDFVIMQIGYGRYANQLDKTFARDTATAAAKTATTAADTATAAITGEKYSEV